MTLDPRQRAMLQDMGITVWLPKPAAVPAPVTAALQPHATVAGELPPAPVALAPAQLAAPVATPTAAPIAATARPAPVQVEATPPAAEAAPATAWQMSSAVQAYPQATGGHASDAWLVIWECPHPTTPLEGDTGKLLNNMLRALRLQHSPHVWIAGVQRPGHEALPVAGIATAPVAWQTLASGLPAAVQQTQPARILVLGLQAARAVLGSQDALGRLRAQVHQVQGVAAVVSYDPAYLLRSPHAKPAAWADLCRAHALRPPSAA